MSTRLERLEKIRRAKLQELIDTEAHGNAALFARMHEIGQSLVSRYVSDGARSKTMGYDAARGMEERINASRVTKGITPLKSGYLDDPTGIDWILPKNEAHPSEVPHSEAKSPDNQIINDIVAELAKLGRRVQPERRDIVAKLAATLITDGSEPIQQLLREELQKTELSI